MKSDKATEILKILLALCDEGSSDQSGAVLYV